MKLYKMSITAFLVLSALLPYSAFADGKFAEIACRSSVSDKETGESLNPIKIRASFADAEKSGPVLLDTKNYYAYLGVSAGGYMVRLVDKRIAQLPFRTGQLAVATTDLGAKHIELVRQDKNSQINIYCWFKQVVAE